MPRLPAPGPLGGAPGPGPLRPGVPGPAAPGPAAAARRPGRQPSGPQPSAARRPARARPAGRGHGPAGQPATPGRFRVLAAGCALRLQARLAGILRGLVAAALPAAPRRPLAAAAAPLSPGTRAPGSPSPITTSRASPSSTTIRVRPSWEWEMSRVPPPGGSRKACAHAPAGDGTDWSAVPLRVAVQPPAGSASSSVPPPRGAAAPETLTCPEGTATSLPPGPATRTRAVVVATRHSWKSAVLLTGRRSATLFSVPASAASAGAGSRT